MIHSNTINKSLIIPTEDLRPTSFNGPNDINNIDEAALINFGLLSKKSKKMIKII